MADTVRRPTAAYREAVKAGKERPHRRDVNRRDRGLGNARDRLHEALDALGPRVPTADELVKLAVLAVAAFVPRSAAARTLGAFVRYVEDLHAQAGRGR